MTSYTSIHQKEQVINTDDSQISKTTLNKLINQRTVKYKTFPSVVVEEKTAITFKKNKSI